MIGSARLMPLLSSVEIPGNMGAAVVVSAAWPTTTMVVAMATTVVMGVMVLKYLRIFHQ